MDLPVIRDILIQHVDELAGLWVTRQSLVASGHVGLPELGRIDERIAAHQDGVVVGGSAALEILTDRMADGGSERAFALGVVALVARDPAAFEHLQSAAVDARTSRGLSLAFGWVPRECLADVVRVLLASDVPGRRRLGLTACRQHGVDPGVPLLAGLADGYASLRAEALRIAGEIGRRDLDSRCAAATGEDDVDCRLFGARSAVLLGNRNLALGALTVVGSTRGPRRATAFRLALQAMDTDAAHAFLQQLRRSPESLWWLIQGSGIAGVSGYIPWLLGHMAVPATARVAAEAFMTITGLDLFQGFEAPRPEDFETSSSDNAGDENVELDPDEGLPWPDRQKVESWWAANQGRFPNGTRFFMGAPVTREHCINVLKTGYQRQRILAAHYLCLLEPGTPLFNTSAPAWRQRKLLAQM